MKDFPLNTCLDGHIDDTSDLKPVMVADDSSIPTGGNFFTKFIFSKSLLADLTDLPSDFLIVKKLIDRELDYPDYVPINVVVS